MKYFAIIVFSGGEHFWWGTSNPVGQAQGQGQKRLVPVPEKKLSDTVETGERALSPGDKMSVVELDLCDVFSDK